MGLIPEEIIRQILDRADIVEVVSSYLPLRQAGRNFKALSPFKHEKTPSFVVSPDKQIFHCFSTGIGGNVFSFVMQMERVTFPEAVRLMADRYGVVIPETDGFRKESRDTAKEIRRVNSEAAAYYHRNLLSDRSPAAESARTYLKARGVSLEAVKTFQLGFALDEWDGLIQAMRPLKISLALMEQAGLIIPRKSGDGYYDRFRNRIIFPIFDERGRGTAFGARTMESGNPVKYVNSPETPVYVKGRHLYGFHLSKDAAARADAVIIVEGYMDFIMPYLSGIQHIAASLGTALTPEQIRLIRRYTRNVVMLYDADPAGEAAMNRSLDLLLDEGMSVRVARLPDHEDPDSYVRAHGAEAFRRCVDEAKTVVDFKIDFLTARYGRGTVEGRSRIASEILPTVSRFRDPIARTEAVTTLARSVSVVQNALMTEKALLQELDRLAKQTPGRRSETVTREAGKTPEPFSAMHPAEEALLMLMLIDRRCVQEVRESGMDESFTHEAVRTFVKKIEEIADQGREVMPAALISETEEDLGNFLSGLLAKEESIVGDKMRICRDCIARLRERRSRAQRRMILSEMERAREAGDQHRLIELTEEFNRLIKGVPPYGYQGTENRS